MGAYKQSDDVESSDSGGGRIVQTTASSARVRSQTKQIQGKPSDKRAAAAFATIEILLFAVTLFGMSLFVGKAVFYSRRWGISATTYLPLLTRWMLHELEIREDEACKKLLFALPSTSVTGLRALMWATFVAHRLTGHVPIWSRYPDPGDETFLTTVMARTEFFDRLLDEHLEIGPQKAEQVVFLGAGYDTRAYSMSSGPHPPSFEVDMAETQQRKLEALLAAGVESSHVEFVAVDFNTESWLEKLRERGFDTTRRTIFLWEGVTYYLDPSAVEATLATVANGAAEGSILAFDYFSDELVSGRFGESVLQHYIKTIMNLSGEPLRFGISTYAPRKHVEQLLEAQGLTLSELRLMGGEEARKRPIGGLVAARV